MNVLQPFKIAIKNWWAFAIIGATLIFMGILVLRHPLESYLSLSFYFSLVLLMTGLSQVYFSISNRETLKSWGWHLAGALLEVAMGIILLSHPALSMGVLPVIVGLWLMFRGFSLIGISTDLKSLGLKNWGWVMAGGILSAVFAFFIIVNPIIGMLTIVGWTAIAAFLSGGLTLYLSYQIKVFGDDIVKLQKYVGLPEEEVSTVEAEFTN